MARKSRGKGVTPPTFQLSNQEACSKFASKWDSKIKEALVALEGFDRSATLKQYRGYAASWKEAEKAFLVDAFDVGVVGLGNWYLARVYSTERWQAFATERTEWYHRTKTYKARKAKTDAVRYTGKVKAERSTPEAKALLAARKREERARRNTTRDQVAADVASWMGEV